MKFNELQPKKGSRRKGLRLGRGYSSGKGASCGKGMRGQKARAGSGPMRGFEGGQMPLYRRVPKLKNFPRINPPIPYTTINVGQLASLEANTEVTLESLMEAGLITKKKYQAPLKILGDGELNVPLQVKANAFSKTARQKIESAGGSCEVVG